MKKILLFCALLFSACSSSNLGYGIILWSDSELSNGQLIIITKESKVKQSYEFEHQGQSYNLPINRVAFFRHMPNAKAYQEKFLQYKNWYAINKNSSGLIMRAAPSAQSEQIYRLRPNQKVKVLEQASKSVTMGGIQGKWYEVLTDDGIRAYVFDYYLHIEDRGQKVIKLAVNEAENSEFEIDLDSIKKGYWYLKKNLKQRLDIRLLQLPHGQLQVGKKQLKLYFEKPYTSPFVINYSEIDTELPLELRFLDSSARITFKTATSISIYYHDKNRQESIAELEKISEEQRNSYRLEARAQRRKNLAYILERGSQFSAAKLYGSVQFRSDGHFSWSNTVALAEQDMLQEPQTEGYIYFLYQAKLKSYDKVLTFVFKNGEELSFLLKIDGDRVYMRYLPPYMTKKSHIIRSDAIAEKIDLQMVLEGRPLQIPLEAD